MIDKVAKLEITQCTTGVKYSGRGISDVFANYMYVKMCNENQDVYIHTIHTQHTHIYKHTHIAWIYTYIRTRTHTHSTHAYTHARTHSTHTHT